MLSINQDKRHVLTENTYAVLGMDDINMCLVAPLKVVFGVYII